MGERVLIVGAQGFVGRYLACHWLETDPEAEILGVGRSPALRAHFTHQVHWGDLPVRAPLPASMQATLGAGRYRYQRCDLSDLRERPAFIKALQEFRPTVLVHLAASLRDDAPDRLVQVNVGTAVGVLEGLTGAEIELPMVVLGSTGAVYGDPGAQLPIPESFPCNPVEVYGASKRAAESVSAILTEKHGIRAVWARIFNPLGPGQDERHFCGWLGRQLAAIRAGLKPPTVEVGTLTTTRDFVDVRDVARSLKVLAERGEPGHFYNVGSGLETQIERVLEEALAQSGMADAITVVHNPGREAGVKRHVADIRSLRALGFELRHTLPESLRDVLAYYRESVEREAREGARLDPSGPEDLLVRIEESHSYPVFVESGIFQELPARLGALFAQARMVVLTDRRVDELYGRSLVARLEAAGIQAAVVVVPEGERSKAMERLWMVVEQVHAHRFDRRAVLLCLGGGLVTDLGGLVAATYMRGVSYVNIPTTLIAQHDAAIGGKVAINAPWAKNFVGAFHHPRAVFADPSLLRTLDDRSIASGLAEAIKVAICGEPELFLTLEREAGAIRDRRDPEVLGEVVRRASRKKIALLAPDPYEVDLRRALNLGHCFAHPLETELGYEGISHGEAVGFGIAVATAVAHRRGACNGDDAERIYCLLDRFALPPPVPRARLESACRRIEEVRLIRANRLNFVLPTSIASTQILPDLEEAEIIRAIARLAEHPILGRCVASG